MKWRCLLLACLCFYVLFNGVAQAQGSRWPLNWGDWETATGDWGGYRTKLNDMGIDPELNYTHDIMANPVGGERQSAAYAGALGANINFDFEKLMGLSGTSFSLGLYQGLGRDLSGEDINNVFDVAQIFIGDVFGISQMNILQTLANDRVEIAIGRLSAGRTLRSVRLSRFMSTALLMETRPNSLKTCLHLLLPLSASGVFGEQ
nr:carbohydrate porin [Pseudovibrio sp. W64]